MADLTGKLNPNLQNLRVDSTPNLNVTPVLQHGGPTPDVMTAMQSAITALQAQNDKLAARVAELEKSMVAVRLVLQGVDPAFATVNKKVDDLRAEYAVHQHDLPFDYESFTFLQETGDNNKPNFLMAYVWEGGHSGWTDFQRQQDAQARGVVTGKPQAKS